jgi:Cenp-O kinetochore centromere component.
MSFVAVEFTFFLLLWHTGSWVVIRYFLPDSVNVREMVESITLKSDKELINFIQSVQLCVEAYHDRKHQITLAKVMYC